MKDTEGRIRVVITGVSPEIEGGRFPIKRTVGEDVVVEANIFVDGHDTLSATLLYRHEDESEWRRAAVHPLGNDRWRGRFMVTVIGRYHYTLRAQIDHFTSWQRSFAKRVEAGQDVAVDLLIGVNLIEEASKRATGDDAKKLHEWVTMLRLAGGSTLSARARLALAEDLGSLISKYQDRQFAATYAEELIVVVDREQARFSAWYELFPRSCSARPGQHGSFKDCEARLPYVASMGFDVLYLPPLHPIGRTYRKGKNNTLEAGSEDPGSPWAIGAEEGGHKAIHPQLGTLEDFRRLAAKAKELGLELALDLAFQCAPDHPYVTEHPEWFRHRPDGGIQYAENPPKKYQDIYPFDFETAHWQLLWEELLSVVRFWLEQEVRIFRVDNPHTKPFGFWEWLITKVKKDYPDALFLSEAFTRPQVMYRLAKLGFTQSYTYFTWRNTKTELAQYFTEVTRTEVQEYLRPNLWPNTPDILTEYLQLGGRPAFITRLILAATLSANYGIYGPAFELGENRPRELGGEEYLDSEKYEIRQWDLDQPHSLKDLIARVNQIRRNNPALQSDRHLQFHPIDNEQLLCYSKHTSDGANAVLVVVNLDPHHSHAGWMELSFDDLGLDPRQPYQVHDLLSGARYLWQGARNYVELNPQVMPAHIFRIRRRVRTERDFDYYM
jgi:starch synthase (maltosyl-transferring)